MELLNLDGRKEKKKKTLYGTAIINFELTIPVDVDVDPRDIIIRQKNGFTKLHSVDKLVKIKKDAPKMKIGQVAEDVFDD
jgi:hypothetical protein